MKPFVTVLPFFFSSAFLFSCAFAPVNNQYEKAGTLKKGNLELAGSFTRYSGIGEGGSANLNNNLGFRVGYGISDKFDLKFRYERLMPCSSTSEDFFDESFKGVNYFSIVPKIALIPERLSLLIPVSHYLFKEEIDGEKSSGNLTSITPQIIYTINTAKNKTDFSFGFKADCFLGDVVSIFPAATIGAGFSSDLSKWAVRPEIGAIYIAGGAFIISYGVGCQFTLPKRKN